MQPAPQLVLHRGAPRDVRFEEGLGVRTAVWSTVALTGEVWYYEVAVGDVAPSPASYYILTQLKGGSAV